MVTENLHAERTAKKQAILLTCYMTGSTSGKNLGTPGYSYDFVAQLFSRLLSDRGEVIAVPDPKFNLEEAAQQARNRGLSPVHVSFLPFQDVHLCKTAPNVVVPAWEFPDIPDHDFDNNHRNNWIAMANQTDMVLVGGPFTVDSMRRGGATSPINIVPVPTPDPYFQIPLWQPDQTRTVNCRAYWPKQENQEQKPDYETRKSCFKQARRSLVQSLRNIYKTVLGPERYQNFSDAMKKRRNERRRKRAAKRSEPDVLQLNYPSTSSLELSGVVYTSIFNPDDGRKNWHDLLNGFLYALGDRDDATLVVKLITRRREAADQVIRYYQEREIPHRCKVAFVVDYLSNSELVNLAQASTFYLQTTKAEGNCLPLMNYLSAARPGVSPNHSAMSDYFDSDLGWVIDSNPEPAAWPHDSRLRMRTTWGRIVWTSCRDAIRASYDVATKDAQQYQQIAERCRSRMQNWASYSAVTTRLNDALDQLQSMSASSQEIEPIIYKLDQHIAERSAHRKAA